MLRAVTLVVLGITSLLVIGCSNDSGNSPLSPSGGTLAIENIAASVSADDRPGVRRPGAAPRSSGGPRITASGNQRVINGGTQTVAISADAPFDTVFMYVGGRSVGLLDDAPGGIEGYYEVRVPAPQTASSVLLTFPQEIGLDEFDLQFAVASPSGAVGPYVGLSTTVTQVGTGDIQVTLSWDADSDTDLHVVAPGGEEVYYGRREVASGGTLDLDSNAGCGIDGVRNENITWPTGRAPRGVYTVRVDYWSACGVNQTNYTVLVNNGGNVQIFSGTFTGPGDNGGAGSGRTIVSFERLTGPAALLPRLGAAPALVTPKTLSPFTIPGK